MNTPDQETAGEVHSEPTIHLDQFLKIKGIGSGGQAKVLIQSGEVSLNGEVETRRRKQIRAGDKVELLGEVFIVEPLD